MTATLEQDDGTKPGGYRADPGRMAALPPELRDQLLEYIQRWGTPQEQITAVQSLREAHGPLLFLLDYHATACLAAGDPARR